MAMVPVGVGVLVGVTPTLMVKDNLQAGTTAFGLDSGTEGATGF